MERETLSIDFFYFLLLVFASFRLTRLLVFDQITKWIRTPFLEEKEHQLEDGSVEIHVMIKGRGLKRWIGELLSCYWCTGVWCSIFLLAGYWLLPIYFIPIILILAVAAGASIVETVVQRLSNH